MQLSALVYVFLQKVTRRTRGEGAMAVKGRKDDLQVSKKETDISGACSLTLSVKGGGIDGRFKNS